MRGSISALRATPHDFAADAQVFRQQEHSPAFVSLLLRIGTDEIAVMLPAAAYQGARNVADAWLGLMDQRPMELRPAPIPTTEGVSS